MHDTPNKWAFRYPFRWVSHGCVRLEKPLEMARFLLAFNKDKDKKIPEIVYDEKKRTESDTFGLDKPITIHIKKWIPVFFDYRTAKYDKEKSKVTYSFDVYGYDKMVVKHINHFF
jgi:L,D-transpeptidase YcbB